jgi:type IV secretory pathway VirB2 component (pilin)
MHQYLAERKKIMKKKLLQKLQIARRDRFLMVRLMTLLVMCGLLFTAAPALAQSGVGGKFEEIINKIVETVQNLTLVIGLMGLVLWGFGKVARPIVPQISQLTQQYFMQFIIGIVVVFSASEIVEMIAGAVGA